MKILQVIPTLSAGGAEGFVTNLGVSLAGLGAEVRFFLMAGGRGERGQVLLTRLREAGIEVVGAEEHNVHSLMNIVHLVGLIRSWRPDIVQANLYSAEILVAVASSLSIGSGARYTRRLTGTEICGYRSTTVVRIMDRFYRQTIACSPAVAKSYRDFMGATHKSELITIPNGGLLQEAVTTTEEKRQARETLDISGKAFVVAHIGRMLGGAIGTGLESEPKAQDVLLKAFAKAFVGDPECVLALVGDGPLRLEAESLAKSLDIATQVRFLGQRSEPWPVLEAADVFCFPSRHEGLPNVLPEAASCGLPVVASDIPEIRSLYPGDAWLLKPVDDVMCFAHGLREIAAQYTVYKERAEATAPGFRTRFSMETCARRYLKAYESVLERHTP
jgi:glycosyltransferase involved in cell wall biosynthesis